MQEFEPGVGTGNILLVDDESSVLETSSMMLELLGFSVTGQTSPQSALDSLKESVSFDLIFTDLDMPEMNGRDFAKAVRAISVDVPVIVVSGYVLDEDDWKPDFDGILMKPFRVQDLKDKVDEFLVKKNH